LCLIAGTHKTRFFSVIISFLHSLPHNNQLKRYIIFCRLRLLAVAGIVRALAALARAGASAGASTTSHKLEVLYRYSKLAAFRAVLGFPAIERQAPFYKQRISLLTILIDDLGSLTEHPAVNKAGFFPLAAVLASPPAIRGYSEIHHRRLVRRIGQLRVAGQIAH
jgi:hypothetical protein